MWGPNVKIANEPFFIQSDSGLKYYVNKSFLSSYWVNSSRGWSLKIFGSFHVEIRKYFSFFIRLFPSIF